MNLLLDTHFLLWILLGSKRLKEFPWLERYRPWGVSPISMLEIQFLSEVGHVEVQGPELYEVLQRDSRFVVDEVPLLALITKALSLEGPDLRKYAWTR